MRFASVDQRIPITAAKVQALISAPREDTQRMTELSRHAPLDEEAVLALVQGLKHKEWRVALGCALSLGGADEGAEHAVGGLQQALAHEESSLRGDAAGSLNLLAQKTDLNLDLVWEAYINETAPLAFIEMGSALLTALRRPQTPPSRWPQRRNPCSKRLRRVS